MTVFALDEEFERAKAERRKNLDRRLEREVRLETARRQRLTDRLARIPLPAGLALPTQCHGCGWMGGLEAHNRQCSTTGERSYVARGPVMCHERTVDMPSNRTSAPLRRIPLRSTTFAGFGV